MRGFLSTLSLVCRIKIPLRGGFDSSRMGFYLPLTGVPASISFLIPYIMFYFFSGSSGFATGAGLISLYLCFNLFHLDGLIDTADAFLGNADSEKTKLILKDSRIGVYGFFAGVSVLAMKFILLYELTFFVNNFSGILIFAVLLFPIVGRTSASFVPALSPPASEKGLGVILRDTKTIHAITGYTISIIVHYILFSAACIIYFLITRRTPHFIIAMNMDDTIHKQIVLIVLGILIPFCTALYFAHLYKKRIAGYTGDALGAAVESAELCYLFAALIVTRL